MKKLCIICLLGFLCSFVLRAQDKITITQCYEWARANYPQIRQFRLIEQAERYTLSNLSKGWLPQIKVAANVTYQSDVTKLPLEDLGTLVPGLEIPEIDKDQYKITVEINQSIWDGGQVHLSKEQAKIRSDADKKELDSQLYKLRERVNNLYFGSLLYKELIKQNLLLQNELQINIDRVEAMMANGLSNMADKEELEVELLSARQKGIELKAADAAYLNMLEALTGNSSVKQAEMETPELPSTLSHEIMRPELQTISAKEKELNIRNKLLNVGINPSISAFVQGGYGRPGLNMLDNDFNGYYVAGLRLSWNIGNFYTIKNSRRMINTNLKQLDVERETFLFNTRLQQIQENEEIYKLSELMKSDEDIIRLRTNIKKAAEVKYANGVISVTDVIREINAENISRQEAVIHRVQQQMAIYNYMYITNN
ncbi:MAG: TolC family protein [Bacteroidaceae bacterium]|nr:TolC family protein [Bacteroidaceae bacterium]